VTLNLYCITQVTDTIIKDNTNKLIYDNKDCPLTPHNVIIYKFNSHRFRKKGTKMSGDTGRRVLMGGQRRMEKALLQDDPPCWTCKQTVYFGLLLYPQFWLNIMPYGTDPFVLLH
jgi:hypothetical protein